MHKIAFIIPYIGNLPWYFPYFLHTCKYNPSIDFYIYTDNEMRFSDIDNVKFINYTLGEFNKEATEALNFPINIDRAYKLCDFKPAYGLIFSEQIKEYDFWGYCDIDVIWGNIRSFMTDELLDQYDVISARHDYLTGCFALYKNNLYINSLFTHSKDFMKVFTSENNYFFDETNFAFKAFEKGLHYSQINTEIESMTHVIRRLQEVEGLRAFFEFQIIEGFAGNMLWDKGTLIYRKDLEAMFYHMVRFKTVYSETLDVHKVLPERFKIGKKKIYGV